MTEADAIDLATACSITVTTDRYAGGKISFHVKDGIYCCELTRTRGSLWWSIDGAVMHYKRGDAICEAVRLILGYREESANAKPD